MNRWIRSIPLVWMLSASAALSQDFVARGRYSVRKPKETQALVAKVDLDAVRTNHLAKYALQRKTEGKDGVKQMVLYDKDTRLKLEVRLMLLPTLVDAENGVLDLLNGASVTFNTGVPSGHAVGDTAWYFMTKETGATTIIFIRRNVVVWLFAQDKSIADELAENVDADVQAGRNGIVLTRNQ